VSNWVNSQPLKLKDLRGKVVVLHFWTFGCINCRHNLPYYNRWQVDFEKDELAAIAIEAIVADLATHEATWRHRINSETELHLTHQLYSIAKHSLLDKVDASEAKKRKHQQVNADALWESDAKQPRETETADSRESVRKAMRDALEGKPEELHALSLDMNKVHHAVIAEVCGAEERRSIKPATIASRIIRARDHARDYILRHRSNFDDLIPDGYDDDHSNGKGRGH
jgi:thiol-disulfide isomerase/thioredoxin